MDDPSLDLSLNPDELIYQMRKCPSAKVPLYKAWLEGRYKLQNKRSKALAAKRRANRNKDENKSENSDGAVGSSGRLRSMSRSKDDDPEDKCGCKRPKRHRRRSCGRKKKRSCRSRRKSRCRSRKRRRRSCSRRRRKSCGRRRPKRR